LKSALLLSLSVLTIQIGPSPNAPLQSLDGPDKTQYASGLFHRAIIQSAAPIINNYSDSKINWTDFVNEYITTGTDSAKFLSCFLFIQIVSPKK